MGKPVNMSPEEYARQIIAEQQALIKVLEDNQGAHTTTQIYNYSFSANTSEPPSGNQMRVDATPATKIWAHKLTLDGVDVLQAFTNYHAGDRVYIQDKNDSSSYGRYVLSADPIFEIDYVELPVSAVDTGATLNGGQPAILAMTVSA